MINMPSPVHESHPVIILVTGPARSGKSEWAERLAAEREQAGQSVLYVATSTLDSTDAEWMARVDRHRQRRPPSWKTLDVPFDLASVIQHAPETDCLLVDSLGTWLANGLDWNEETWDQQRHSLLTALQHGHADVIFVAEETGWGVIPAYPAGRLFRDRLGTLTREIGAIAHATYLVTAGFALNLRDIATPID